MSHDNANVIARKKPSFENLVFLYIWLIGDVEKVCIIGCRGISQKGDLYVGKDRMKKKNRQWKWWIFAIFVLFIFIVLQIPATWLIAKFSKDYRILQNVSGNIWQGQADWQQGQLRGTVHWKTRPLDLFLLRLGADLDVHSGNTQLNGIVSYGFAKKIGIKHLSGRIAPETLKAFAHWQWPENTIQLQELQVSYQPQQGFSAAQGQLHWGGGTLVYQFGQRQERMNVPVLNADLLVQDGQLNFNIYDQRQQKMAHLSLDANLMLNIQLTQRLLLNVPSYQGKAGLDTYVVSSRQPLLQGGF